MLAAPEPHQKPTESDIDDVLAQIDTDLRRVHAKAKGATTRLLRRRPPHAADIKQTRMEFQAMSEDSLLTDSGDDITLAEVEAKLAKSGVVNTDADADAD